MKRRTFLKTVAATTGGVALGYRPVFADPAAPDRQLHAHASGLPRRTLGRTGAKISIAGYPGLALARHPQEDCNNSVRQAFDAGINYFDVAPAYGNGKAEINMGLALAATKIPRDQIFLSCKTKRRDGEGARVELERSLERLKTDHFDLYQLHVVSTDKDVEEIFAPGGAMETLLKARKEGKVRWLGFSAHTKPAALALLKGYKFDSVMYPINFIEHFTHKFDPEVLALCRSTGAAAIAIKAISAGSWKPGDKKTRNNYWYRTLEEPAEIAQAMRFSLSLDPVVSIIPTSFFDITERSIAGGKAYRPATDADLTQLRELAGKYAPLFPPKPRAAASFSPHSEYYASHA